MLSISLNFTGPWKGGRNHHHWDHVHRAWDADSPRNAAPPRDALGLGGAGEGGVYHIATVVVFLFLIFISLQLLKILP